LHYPLSDNIYDKILDCSGYGHDGVRMGTGFINDNDAPRRHNSLHFSGSDSILATHALSPTKATVATWIKFDNALENSIIAFADNKSKIAFGYYSNANYFILSCNE
jgi:hypothetical protein